MVNSSICPLNHTASTFQEEPPNKKKRVESSTNWTGAFTGKLSVCGSADCSTSDFFVSSDEVDEIEVYGSEAQSGTQLATFSFEVKSWLASLEFSQNRLIIRFECSMKAVTC